MRGRGEGLAAALAWYLARSVDFLQYLLPLGLPVAQATAEQRPGQHDAPVAALLADTDIDELRVEHYLAKLSSMACIAARASRGPDRLMACTLTMG